MAWGNTDGPEMGPEWHGHDRGTNSNWGCVAVMLSFIIVLLLLVFAWLNQ